MGKITTKKRILFSFRGQVTINGQIMSEKPGIFCAQNGQKLWVFGQPVGGGKCDAEHDHSHEQDKNGVVEYRQKSGICCDWQYKQRRGQYNRTDHGQD